MKQTFPIVKEPVPCGRDNDMAWGREGSQGGWYAMVGHRGIGRSILDVGCGCGFGLDVMREAGALDVTGIDVDQRLAGMDPAIRIGKIEDIRSFSFDIVACMDVIEHVVDDLEFFGHLKRIARREVIISTPNWNVSHCRNQCHCREYTPDQFAEFFGPMIHLMGLSDGSRMWARRPDRDIHPHQCGIWLV